MITRTGKYMKHTSSRFRKFAQGLLRDSTIRRMEDEKYDKMYTSDNKVPSDKEVLELLKKYGNPQIEESPTIVEELNARKSINFQPKVYADIKKIAKENKKTISEVINQATYDYIVKYKLDKDFLKMLEKIDD